MGCQPYPVKLDQQRNERVIALGRQKRQKATLLCNRSVTTTAQAARRHVWDALNGLREDQDEHQS